MSMKPWYAVLAALAALVASAPRGLAAAPAVVAQPVVVAQFVAVPVAVPLYAVGYDPATLALVEELKGIREELKRQREGGIPQGALPEVASARDRALAVLQSRCAACHTGDAAKGGVKMFDAQGRPGDVNPFTLWDAADARKMPPDPRPKLTAQELATLRQWVRESAKAAR